MRRIATGSNRNPAIDQFGPGKHGFKTGNRSLGDPPSTPGGEWFNSIQEELARVVEATGVSLDPAKFDQLLTSIKFIAWGAGKTAAPWAPLSSPVLTDTPTAPTATDGTNTTQIASTAFVQSAVGGYLSKSITGGTVTLTDAEASNPVLGFSGTLTSNATVVLPASIKRLWAIYNATAGAYTVTVKLTSGTGVTVAQGKRNLVYTDGSNVYDGFNDFESVALTGAPTAPTAAVDTSTTQIASTAFVINQASSTTPIVDGAPAVGTSKRYARGDHVHPTDTTRAAVASFANVKTASGYQRFEGGMIMQWGTYSVGTAAQANVSVSFPIAFPSLCLHGIVNVDNAATDQLGVVDKSKTGMTVQKGVADTANRTGTWIAIGY